MERPFAVEVDARRGCCQTAGARAEQRLVLKLSRDGVVMWATPQTLSWAKRRVAWLEGRIGRLTPKVYRAGL